MRDKVRDIERLHHMSNAIEEIQIHKGDEWIKEINENKLLFYSLVKLLEIVGEAAYMLTKEFKSSHPDLYWQSIEDMRHVMVHGYYKIDLKKLINTVDNDLPFIYSKINTYIAEHEMQ